MKRKSKNSNSTGVDPDLYETMQRLAVEAKAAHEAHIETMAQVKAIQQNVMEPRANERVFPPGEATWGMVTEGIFPHGKHCSGDCELLILAGDFVLVLPASNFGGKAIDVAIHYECLSKLFFGDKAPQRIIADQAEKIRAQYLKNV